MANFNNAVDTRLLGPFIHISSRLQAPVDDTKSTYIHTYIQALSLSDSIMLTMSISQLTHFSEGSCVSLPSPGVRHLLSIFSSN